MYSWGVRLTWFDCKDLIFFWLASYTCQLFLSQILRDFRIHDIITKFLKKLNDFQWQWLSNNIWT